MNTTITVNGHSHTLGEPMPLRDLLVRLEMTAPHLAVEVNLELVPRAEHAEFVVQPGDELEVVTLAGGG